MNFLSRRIRAPLGLLALCASLSAPADSPLAERIALVSDLNGRYGSTSYDERVSRAAAVIVADRPKLVISTGDMVAGQSPKGLAPGTHDAMWAAFQAAFGAPLQEAGIPLAVTVGNHDGSAYPGFETDRDRFENHWAGFGEPPGLLPGSEWPWRYALRQNGLLAITFDGTLPGAVPKREQEFVRAMLEAHGAEAEWTVVFSHLPFWPLARGREDDIIEDAGFLELLHEHGVDAYASGHHHVFYAGQDEAGMLHLSVSALGGNSRHYATGGNRQAHGFVELERIGEVMVVTSLTTPDFTSGVDFEDLPEQVSGPAGTLRRVSGPIPLRN